MCFSPRDEVAQRIDSVMVFRIPIFFLISGGWIDVKSMECVTVGGKEELIKVYSFKFNLREKNAVFPIDNFSLSLFERGGQLLYFYVAYNT